jgi:16S rRNA (guanine966-N2)-methyltransferase
VIAGEKGGRRLVAPPGRSTRPTSDRAREAVFSMLASLGALEGATAWDLFAGSGALGIEALSRGAAHVTFVDHARAAVGAAKANLAQLGFRPDQAEVVCADALAWARAQLPAPERAPGLVLADPPYAWDGWGELLGAVGAHRPLVMMETGRAPDLPPGWDVLRSKRYGGTVVTLARRDAGDKP